MSITTWHTEDCLANGRKSTDGVTLTADSGLDAATVKSIPLAPKSIPLAPSSVDPAGEPMASGESVMTRGSDGRVGAVENVGG